MTRRMLGTLLAVTALVGVGCGFGGGSKADGGAAAQPPDQLGQTAGAQLVRDTNHWYRVVNLHLYNGQPGGAVDIHPVLADNLTRLGSGVPPLVSGLAYGQASDALQPGGFANAGGDPVYGLTVLPHTPTDTGSANLKIDINAFGQSRPWQRAVVVLGGTGNGLQSQTFYDTTGPEEANAVPAAQPGRLSIMIDMRQAGDPNGPKPVTGFWLAGTGSGCLKASNDGTAPTATAVNITGPAFVTVDPGATAVGFWHAAAPDYAASTCTGSPAFSVDLPSLAAGSRSALFVYGPDVDHLAGVVVPFDT